MDADVGTTRLFVLGDVMGTLYEMLSKCLTLQASNPDQICAKLGQNYIRTSDGKLLLRFLITVFQKRPDAKNMTKNNYGTPGVESGRIQRSCKMKEFLHWLARFPVGKAPRISETSLS